MKCPNCGENLKGKFNFCGFCGYDLNLFDKSGETSILKKPISEIFKTSSVPTKNDYQIQEPDAQKKYKENNYMQPIVPPKNSIPDEPVTDDTPEIKSKEFSNITEIPTLETDKPTLEKEIKVESNPKPIIPSISDDDMDSDVNNTTLIKIIDVVGQNKVTAKSMLSYLGLNVVTNTKNSETVPYGDVMSQDLDPGEMVDPGAEIRLIISVGTWTSWTDEMIPHDKIDKFDVEERLEYKCRTRNQSIDYKESKDKDAYPDYEVYDSKDVYSDWVEDDYYISAKKETSQLCQVAATITGFKYCGWVYTSDEFDIIDSYGTASLAVYFNNSTFESDWEFKEVINKQDFDVSYSKWHNSDDNGTLTPAGDIVIANISIAGYEVGGIRYALKFGTKDSEWKKYKTREVVEQIYYFKKNVYTEWGDWSEWSKDFIEENDMTEVDTHKLYRFKRKATI